MAGGLDLGSSDPTRRGTLSLATATPNGVALGGDRADGMALFSADFGNWSFIVMSEFCQALTLAHLFNPDDRLCQMGWFLANWQCV